jgi:hypothetical protein
VRQSRRNYQASSGQQMTENSLKGIADLLYCISHCFRPWLCVLCDFLGATNIGRLNLSHEGFSLFFVNAHFGHYPADKYY